MKTLVASVILTLLFTVGCGYHSFHERRSEIRQAREDFRRAAMETRDELRRAGRDLQRELRDAHRDLRDEFGRW